jgi:hypothetical protein
MFIMQGFEVTSFKTMFPQLLKEFEHFYIFFSYHMYFLWISWLKFIQL